MIKKLFIKGAATISTIALLVVPLAGIHADSTSGNFNLQGIVQASPSGGITINSVTGIKTTGSADGTFQNGWKFVIDATVPSSEASLSMKFDNWLMQGNSNNAIPAAGNIRFYSGQSSNAYNEATAIYINGAGTYTGTMFLSGDLGGMPSGRRHIQVVVDVRIPIGTQAGTYTDNFGIRTQ